MIDTNRLRQVYKDGIMRTHAEDCHEWHMDCAIHRLANELDLMHDLIKNATWAGGDGPIQCPWCAYGYKQPHGRDCEAARYFGWPMDAASFDAAEEEQERRISKPLKRRK